VRANPDGSVLILLHRIAGCCSVLHHGAACCSMLQCIAMCCSAHKFVIFPFLNRKFNENNGKFHTLFVSLFLSFVLPLCPVKTSLSLSRPPPLYLSLGCRRSGCLSLSLRLSLPPPLLAPNYRSLAHRIVPTLIIHKSRVMNL